MSHNDIRDMINDPNVSFLEPGCPSAGNINVDQMQDFEIVVKRAAGAELGLPFLMKRTDSLIVRFTQKKLDSISSNLGDIDVLPCYERVEDIPFSVRVKGESVLLCDGTRVVFPTQVPTSTPTPTPTPTLPSFSTLYSWGSGDAGVLGDSSNQDRWMPQQIGLGVDWQKIFASYATNFASDYSGNLYSWGSNTYYSPDNLNFNVPTRREDLGKNWSKVSSGPNHTLAINSLGELYAFGDNSFGQLGNGSTTARKEPTKIGSSNNWVEVKAGFGHSLAINSAGELYIWGRMIDSIPTYLVPTKLGSASNWSQLESYASHAFVINSLGQLFAIGDNTYGQLGDGTTVSKNSLTRIGDSGLWIRVSTSENHTLALKLVGAEAVELYSWGWNNSGQLGLGNTIDSTTPLKVGSATNWTKISTGKSVSAAINSLGELYTWGTNSNLQLGYNSTISSFSTPTKLVVENFDQSVVSWEEVELGDYYVIAKSTPMGLPAPTPTTTGAAPTPTPTATPLFTWLVQPTSAIESNPEFSYEYEHDSSINLQPSLEYSDNSGSTWSPVPFGAGHTTGYTSTIGSSISPTGRTSVSGTFKLNVPPEGLVTSRIYRIKVAAGSTTFTSNNFVVSTSTLVAWTTQPSNAPWSGPANNKSSTFNYAYSYRVVTQEPFTGQSFQYSDDGISWQNFTPSAITAFLSMPNPVTGLAQKGGSFTVNNFVTNRRYRVRASFGTTNFYSNHAFSICAYTQCSEYWPTNYSGSLIVAECGFIPEPGYFGYMDCDNCDCVEKPVSQQVTAAFTSSPNNQTVSLGSNVTFNSVLNLTNSIYNTPQILKLQYSSDSTNWITLTQVPSTSSVNPGTINISATLNSINNANQGSYRIFASDSRDGYSVYSPVWTLTVVAPSSSSS